MAEIGFVRRSPDNNIIMKILKDKLNNNKEFLDNYTHLKIIDRTQHFFTCLIWALVNMNKGHYSTSCVIYMHTHISTNLLYRHCSSAQCL